MRNRTNQKIIVILLADGFAGQEVVTCVVKMRENFLPVQIVGVSAGLITGKSGIRIKPDTTLGGLEFSETLPQMIVLPNGVQTHLPTDPRISRLIDKVVQNDGVVAVMSTAEPFISNRYAGNDRWRKFVRQGTDTSDAFVETLVNAAIV